MEKHVKVAIVGGGPAGIGAALGLVRRGVKSIALIERDEKIGGIPALYKRKPGGVPTFIRWTRGGRIVFGEEYANGLRAKLSKTNVKVWLETHVHKIEPEKKSLTVVNPFLGKTIINADAIILACGSREKTIAERGWIMGTRSSRVFFTRQILHWIDRHGCLPLHHPVIIGSDLIAYAAAAKLRAAGSSEPVIIDNCRRPKSPFLARQYFRRWSCPSYRGIIQKPIEMVGNGEASAVKLPNGDIIRCDGIVLSGELIANSELALEGGLEVETPSRKPVAKKDNQFSKPGWFVAGNILGGFHGAEWCYFNGLKVAKSVAKYLSQS